MEGGKLVKKMKTETFQRRVAFGKGLDNDDRELVRKMKTETRQRRVAFGEGLDNDDRELVKKIKTETRQRRVAFGKGLGAQWDKDRKEQEEAEIQAVHEEHEAKQRAAPPLGLNPHTFDVRYRRFGPNIFGVLSGQAILADDGAANKNAGGERDGALVVRQVI
ncbi:hypothetical protein T484DRAFT_1867334 [Baffinella frigidus]|nr:hypothetical protein T484DRAFT_1867334 [Cryptophyta sp. CCMP2293]